MPSVSIITLTRNRMRKLQRCLKQLIPQLGQDDEILVIDTGSDDGTREHFATWPHLGVRFIAWDGGGSWAELRNLGVREARGALIAFLDDDCLPGEDWVRRGRAALAACDAIGGAVQSWGITRFPRWWHPEMGWMVGLSVPGHAGPDAGRIHYPFTANLWARAGVCRAEPFQELGGTPGEADGGGYHTGREDAEWWRRLRQRGYRTRFDAGLAVAHAIDPARLDLAYLRRRAQNDGAAWVAREGDRAGRGTAMPPLAYAYWRETLAMLMTPFGEAGGRLARWRLHGLNRARHAAALRALAGPGWSGTARRWMQLARAGGRLKLDMGKAGARRLAAPWLRARPRKVLIPALIERASIVAFGFLGDLVILQSALRGLLAAHPELELRIATPPAGRTALAGLPRTELSITPELKPGSRAARAWLSEWLEEGKPDAIFAPYLHGGWGAALTSIRRPPRPVIAFDSDSAFGRMWRMERLSLRVHKSLRHHEALNLCNLFAVAGLPCEPQPAELRAEAAAAERVHAGTFYRDAREAGTPLILLNPDAGTPFKLWSDAKWGELGKRLLEAGARLVINAARDHPELEPWVPEGERVKYLREAPLADLVAWIAECDGVITVDAGPQHLAHALGVPSITLYGPMDERRWGDFFESGLHQTIRACTPDLTPEEKLGLAENHEVLLIAVEDVLERAQWWLSKS